MGFSPLPLSLSLSLSLSHKRSSSQAKHNMACTTTSRGFFLTSVLVLLVLVSTGITAQPAVHNISLAYNVDAMYCDEHSMNAVMVFYDRLVSLHAESGKIAYNITWSALGGWETKPTVLGMIEGVVLLLAPESYEICGIYAANGTIAWKSGLFVEHYSAIVKIVGNQLWWADNSGISWSYKWLAAVDAQSGALIGNVTLVNQCDNASTITLARFPYVLVERKDYDHDMLHSVMLKFPTTLSSSHPDILWRQVVNTSLVQYYDRWLEGPCRGEESDEDCVLIRWGMRRDVNDTYFMDFMDSVSYRNGSQILERNLRTAQGVHGCPADSYTERSNSVNHVDGVLRNKNEYLAGAFALRCYLTQPDRVVATVLVNASNLTQVWNGYSSVPIAWDDDHVILSPQSTWHVVNLGNNVIGMYSVTVDAYVTATGVRPTSSDSADTDTTTAWPIKFPGMIEESKYTCAAGTFLALQAKNASNWDPYARVVYVIVV